MLARWPGGYGALLHMEIRCLGPLTVSDAGVDLALGGPKQRLVLAHLVVEAGRTVPTDGLIAAVWGDEPPATARNTLQTYVSHLRTALGAERLDGHRQGYRLHAAEEIDARRFESLARQGRASLTDDPGTALEMLSSALELWRGPAFADLADAPSLHAEVTRLEDLRLTAVEDRFAAHLATGAHHEVVGALEALTTRQPLRERAWELLLTALYRCGRQGEALAAYERARGLLLEELGIDPSQRLQQLHRRILSQAPELDLPVAPVKRREPAPHVEPSTDRADARTRQAGGVHTPSDRLPFPGLVASRPTFDYVGRGGLLAELERTWKAAATGEGSRLTLLAGEPGVGKSRTAAETAVRAFEAGTSVLAGRCDEDLAVPYQPFLEALDWQTKHDRSAPLGRAPGHLTRLLPELAHRIEGLHAPAPSDPRVDEHRLYEAVASWLAELSVPSGLLLVLDDLHWATDDTLRMLVHVARALEGEPRARVLVLALYRDTEQEPNGALSAGLAELRRLSCVEGFRLENLAEEEVRELVEDAAGHELDAAALELTRLLYAETEGNPFFVCEVLRHLVETGAARLEDERWVISVDRIDVPAGVRDVVARRLGRLSPTTVAMLRMAAVYGRDADVAVLSRLVDGGTDQVLDALDETLAARLIEETGPDRFRFVHALVRNALLAELSASRRRRHHAAILEVLAEAEAPDVAALAHHALRAGPFETDPERAVRYALAAGEQSLKQRIVTDARRWFDEALEALEALDDPDPRLRLLARCGRGESERGLGDPTYRDTLLEVTRAALDLGHVDIAVRAAIANHRPATSANVGTVDRERIAAIEATLERLGSDDARDRAHLLAVLSLELIFDATATERRLRLADEAEALARTEGDSRLVAWVTATTRPAIAVPARLARLPVLMREATERADALDDPLLRCLARVSEHQSLLGIGDLDGARRCAEEAVALSAETAPFVEMLARFNALQFRAYDGDIAGARAENAACLELGQTHGEPDALTWWGSIETVLMAREGTVGELADTVGSFADASPDIPGWRAAHVKVLTLADRHDEARRLIAEHGLDRPRDLPDDWVTLAAHHTLAIAAFELGDAQLGAALVEEIEPYRDLWAHFHIFCHAPNEVTLALAASAAGRHDHAVEAMERGRDLMSERGMRSHHPWASLYLTRVLQARGGQPDHRRAAAVAREGLATAQELGLDIMASRLETVLAGPPPHAC